MAKSLICSVADCGAPVRSKCLCENHYRRYRRHGDPRALGRAFTAGRTCSVSGCLEGVKSRGLCRKHYQRWLHHGDPVKVAKAPDGSGEAWLREHLTYGGDDCLAWPFGRGPRGYAGHVTVGGVEDYAHRHMCVLAHGPRPSSLHEVAHNCGKGLDACVAPGHLRWDTHKANMADRIIHGTHLRGESMGTSILSEEDVRNIRALCQSKMQKDVAAQYKVHRSTIGSIIRGETWAWLD